MRQPLVIEDVAADARFARDVAEDTGYVPESLMAAPLLHEERALGVLSVLGRPQRATFSLAAMDLLGQFARQAAIALDLLTSARRAAAVLTGRPDDVRGVTRLAVALDALEGDCRGAGGRPVDALTDVLQGR